MADKQPNLIGVIHLPALVGAPASLRVSPSEVLARAGAQAVEETRILAKLGFDGIVIENFGDGPFYPGRVPPETVGCMAVIATAVREVCKVSIGINVLRNDGFSALAVAALSGCDWIRVNVLSGVAATDQGIIQGEAAALLRERVRLRAEHIKILGDIHVKHAVSMSSRSIELALEETVLRAGADGAIVSGATTGRSVDEAQLERALAAAREHEVQLYIGSGTTVENVARYRALGLGLIVGSCLRKGGRAGAPLDLKRALAFKKAYDKKVSKKIPRKK